MKQYQKRVILEKEELDKKITKLETFLENPPDTLVVKEKIRMNTQLKLMQAYSDILAQRIAVF